MVFLVLGLAVFIGIHSIRIVAPEWRSKMISSNGANIWKGIYSIVSLASFALLVYGYSLAKPEAGELYTPFSEMYHAVLGLMAIAFILIMSFSLGQGYIKQKFKHPFLLAIILWSISHLWMNGDAASVTLFGTFLVWAVIDLRSALQRPKLEKPEPKIHNDIIAVILGVVIYGLFIGRFHVMLFGVVPKI